MKTSVQVGSVRGVALMLSLAAVLYVIGFAGMLYFAELGLADDSAFIIGNHPIEAEHMPQLSNAEATTPLAMQIRFALRHRTALDKLIAQQHDPLSPNYHKWLSGDEFRRRFGPSPSEINAVAKWLASEDFTVTKREGNALEFSGAVASAQRAFAVRIAKFGDGSVYANTSDPVIPERLAGVISSVLGLDNMVHAMPMTHPERLLAKAPEDFALQLAQAESDPVSRLPDSIVNGAQAFGPADLRSFYDESVGDGRDGSGSCIAIVGVSDFLDSTMTAFTSQFGLPAISYTRKQYGQYPGLNGAQQEAELDLQWSHVAAPGASIVYHLGGDLISDIAGAVNDNSCGVISISYGLCGVSASYMTSVVDPIFSQAAAQGQSVFVSSGDQGAAGIGLNANGAACVVNNTRSVNEMSADPNVTSVGGTEFTPVYSGGSDQGYAIERVWNDGSGATGGGVSQVFAKPAYQKGPGVPSDSYRDVPDVALIASPNSPGVFFADNENGGAQMVCCIGGTSLSAPVWAGFATVIGQISGNRRLGNFNQIIYPLANAQYVAAGFHDITNGNNNFNGVTGFSGGRGFDLASGWGTVDFNVFASAAKTFLSQSPSPTPSATATTTSTASATPRPTEVRPTSTPTLSATRTASPATATATPMPTESRAPTPAPTRSASGTPSPTTKATSVPTAAPSSSPTPIIVTFPTTSVGSYALQTLLIQNGNSAALSVNVGGLATPFGVYYPGTYTIPPSWTLELRLSFEPVQPGSSTQQLLISTSDPRNPMMTISISGIAISPGAGSRAASRPRLSSLQPRLRAPRKGHSETRSGP